MILKDYHKKYRIKHHQEWNERSKLYYRQNKQIINQKQREKYHSSNEEEKQKRIERSKKYYRENIEKQRMYSRERLKIPEIKKKQQELLRKRRYGLNTGEYDILFQVQNGLCAICGNPPEKKGLAVDHNHKTGQVRGLLCIKCNNSLGLLKENINTLEEMIKYLKKYN